MTFWALGSGWWSPERALTVRVAVTRKEYLSALGAFLNDKTLLTLRTWDRVPLFVHRRLLNILDRLTIRVSLARQEWSESTFALQHHRTTFRTLLIRFFGFFLRLFAGHGLASFTFRVPGTGKK